MAAAYFVFNHKVLDSEILNNDYLPKAVECLNKFNPEILAVHQGVSVVEGETSYDRLVILKFESREQAMEWYNSKEYQDIIHLRTNSVDGVAMLADAWDPASV